MEYAGEKIFIATILIRGSIIAFFKASYLNPGHAFLLTRLVFHSTYDNLCALQRKKQIDSMSEDLIILPANMEPPIKFPDVTINGIKVRLNLNIVLMQRNHTTRSPNMEHSGGILKKR